MAESRAAKADTHDPLPIEQVAKRWIVASDPDEAVELVGAYVGYGLEIFTRDLEPRLRRLG